MKVSRKAVRTINGLAGAALLTLALVLVAGSWQGAGTLAQGEPPPKDLTGETCLGGTKDIDPDGEGPLPSKTYCVIEGRLPEDKAIQIDDVDGLFPSTTAFSAGDGNLFDGPDDPNNSTGLGDRDLPSVAGADYIDWDDLDLTTLSAATVGSVENFHVVDFVAVGGTKDKTSLSHSCMQDQSNAGKADLSQIYIANNEEYLYIGVERLTSSGNTASYWMLTKEPPIVRNVQGCIAGPGVVGQLEFKLSDGDVQFLVNTPGFGKVGDARAFVRTFDGATTAYLTPAAAIAHAGWSGALVPAANLAVSLADKESPGDGGDEGIGHWGSFNDQGNIIATGSFSSAEFVEFAVGMENIFPDQELCGQQLFLTAVSRASTGPQDLVPTESSEFMDAVGPKLYSFGSISATAEIHPVPCGDSFTYCVDALGLGGDPLPNATVTWVCTATDDIDGDDDTVTFDDDAAVSCGADPDTFPVGSIPRNADGSSHHVTCTAHVDDGDTGCEVDTAAEGDVEASLEAVVIGGLDPQTLSCAIPANPGVANITPESFTFMVEPSGGSNTSYLIDWIFTPPNYAPCVVNSTSCTVPVPDDCARIRVGIRVRDANDPDHCTAFERDFGFIQKSTILKFDQVTGCSNVTCSEGPACT
jgi:hypothetical protein